MMPNLSRFHTVIWLLVMCPSRGVKWRLSGGVADNSLVTNSTTAGS